MPSQSGYRRLAQGLQRGKATQQLSAYAASQVCRIASGIEEAPLPEKMEPR